MEFDSFKKIVLDYYQAHKRILPWREKISPYGVLISEIMLQQTQVPRVLQKYPEFLKAFPNFQLLASTPFDQLLKVWQGMGYNRRAKYLQQTAQKIVQEHGGVLSSDPTILETFPGIGPATACSIVVFTYNTPQVFIETNIRRVYLHHFFKDEEGITDQQIFPIVAQTVDQKNPREWYYALMDYGSYLAKQVVNPNRKSKHYTKQPKFEGSRRQVRGGILKVLLHTGPLGQIQLIEMLGFEKERVESVLEDLIQEGFIIIENNKYRIT